MPPADSASAVEQHSYDRAYDTTFALCYVANTLMMIAVSLLFRYADFVKLLGGGEMQLGLIVGTGMIGALGMRAFQGVGIDRFGPRIVWLLSIVLFVSSLLAHLLVTSIHGPAVYLLRILFMIGVSGAFGSSITFVSLRAHDSRIAEMVGVLGSSGFIGLAVGPVLSDWIMGTTIERQHVNQMFMISALMGTCSLAMVAIATSATPAPRIRRRWPPLIAVIRRYHPGPLLLVAIATGLGTQLPSVFLRPFAIELQIPGIKTFFLVYSGAAFAIRWLTRHWTDRVGSRPVALLGLGCLSASMLLFLPVRSELSLAIPAVVSGIAHAFLFPAIVSGGSSTFPSRYRGLATTVTLAMFDFGVLLGQPAVGGLVQLGRRVGWPPYQVMFVVVSLVLALTGITYYFVSRGQQRQGRGKLIARRRASPMEGVEDSVIPS